MYYNQRPLSEHRAAFTLTFPKNVETDQVRRWMRTVASGAAVPGDRSITTFETWSLGSGFVYRLLVPGDRAESTVNQLRAMVPGITVLPETRAPTHSWTYVIELGMAQRRNRLSVPSIEGSVLTLLSSMEQPQPGEAILLQLVTTPMGQVRLPVYGRPRRPSNLPLAMAAHFLESRTPTKDMIDDQRAKLDEPNVAAVLRLAVRAHDQVRAAELLHRIELALGSLQGLHNRLVRWRDPADQGWSFDRLRAAARPTRWPAQLSETELMVLSCWPMGAPNVMGLPLTRTVHIPVAADVATTGIVIGHSNVPGRERPIAITPAGSTMHTYISAPTGGGKSVLLANAFAQVIGQIGCGAMVIETKGESNDLFHKTINYVPP